MGRRIVLPLLAAALLLASCAGNGLDLGPREKGAAVGAAGGAATGAVIGGATGGSVAGGAALGGLAGGLAGYFFGDRVFRDEKAVAAPAGSTSGAGTGSDTGCRRANDVFRQAVEAERLERKAELYRQGLDLCPNNAYAHNDLGTVYLRMGRTDDARAEYRRALALKPDLEETRRNLELLG